LAKLGLEYCKLWTRCRFIGLTTRVTLNGTSFLSGVVSEGGRGRPPRGNHEGGRIRVITAKMDASGISPLLGGGGDGW